MDRPERAPDVLFAFHHDLRAPAAARDAVRRLLAGWPDPTCESVILAVSELVANVVQHTVSGGVLRAWNAGSSVQVQARIEVEDFERAMPIPSDPERTVGGHGLRIVGGLAAQWGVSATADGKVVWAEFGAVGHRGRSRPWTRSSLNRQTGSAPRWADGLAPELDLVAAVAGTAVPTPLVPPLLPGSAGVDIAQFVALRAAACVGADYSNFALIDPDDARMLRLFHDAPLDADVATRYVRVPLAAPFPITTALRDRRVVVLSGADDYLQHFPEIWEDTVQAGIEATVSMPLARSDGTAIGAMGFAWSASPSFDVKLENALAAVAHLVTEIVQRAELYEVEHRLIADLHRRLLSDLPETEGLTTAARYTPAGRASAVGGDWFEGVHLDDGSLAIVVGDVTGHGLLAAADMALVRGAITALLHDGVPIDEVFARVARILARRHEQLLATAALAVIDRAASTLTYATAGHPPPLLIRPDGAISRLDQANASMLGVGASRRVAATVPFPEGATLIMYTDGLVEASDRPFSDGIDQAVDLLAAEGARLAPDRYIEILVDALGGDHSDHDDVAVVVVQHTGLPRPLGIGDIGVVDRAQS